jgi:hypothetical protein
MRYFTSLLFAIFISVALQAQVLQPSVIALSGGFITLQNGNNLSWTVGEPVIHTLTGSDIQLTQGFQQPLLETVTSYYDPDFDYYLSAFPNPVQFELRLETDYPEELRYFLYDISGKILRTHKFNQEEMMDFRPYPAGVYVLKIMTLEKIVRSLMIEKF